MPKGFGIIGCGMIANFHARAIADIPGAKLVACYNRTAPKAEALSAEFGGDVYTDLDAMLAREDLDIVTICSPSGAHMEPCIAAARAGKHVIVEKPLDVTPERCDAMIEACKQANVQLATIFPSRFHRASQLMKQAVEAGRFGTLALGDAYVKWFRTQEYYDSGAWRGTWALDGGGALMNQAIHSVDLLLWLMGPAVEVMAHTATLAHDRIEVEDVATATIRFANGALGVIEATTAGYPGSLKKIEISGSKGMAVLEEEDIVKWEFAEPTPEDEQLREEMQGRTKTGGGAADPAAIGHHAHAELFRDFLLAIEEQRPPIIDGHEGRRSVELILAIYKSARTGQKVVLGQ
ncbi:putative oxidoreductase YcjS [Aureliella helgolandensis]|uniref:Putative oxidoreductase YcjS n=2 Tax=Aureliella helgolandensis TaxID=2527968 RepID=A0A518GCA0_9BACT|nr:putative oxidoreductase YcjS [Aureliella helgolandensis]